MATSLPGQEWRCGIDHEKGRSREADPIAIDTMGIRNKKRLAVSDEPLLYSVDEEGGISPAFSRAVIV